MILAAPLVIPFAEAVGISIATLGMAKAADMVNDYIQENPEQSAMILKTLVPNLGIGEIFMKKDSGDEEVSEDIDVEVEEKPKKLSGKEKGMRIKEAIRRARAGKGNYSSPDAEGDAVDIRGSVIREVEDMGIADKNLKDKPYREKGYDFRDYIPKGAYRRRKADGGAIGIEVLFEEKKPRKNFFMGGPALEGQALNIYNSMNSYGFQDQEIADALSAQGLYTAPGSGAEPPTTIQPVGFQGSDNTPKGLLPTFSKDLSGDSRFNYLTPKQQANKYRFDRSVEPRDGLMGLVDKTKNFFAENKFFQPKVRGTLGTRLANQPQLPGLITSIAGSMSPFNMQSKNYNPLLESQLNFAELGDNLIGRDPGTGGLKYGSGSVLSGKNVISGFGTNDYETALRNFISKMNANKRISTERKTARLAAAEAELAALLAKTEADRAAQYGQTDYGRGSDGQRSYSGDALGDKDQGFGIGATTGGPVSNRTGRGRTGYSDGGLATMFTRRR